MEVDDTEAALKTIQTSGGKPEVDGAGAKVLLHNFLAKAVKPRQALARAADTHSTNQMNAMQRVSLNRSQHVSMADDVDLGASTDAANYWDNSHDVEADNQPSLQPDQPSDGKMALACQPKREPVRVPPGQNRNPVYKWHNEFLSVRQHGREQMQVGRHHSFICELYSKNIGGMLTACFSCRNFSGHGCVAAMIRAPTLH